MSETKCFFDGSHMSPFDFSVRVIDYAISRGFELDEETYRKDVDDMRNGEVNDEWVMSVLDALDWTYDDALDYLNEIDNPAGRAWWVEDQSLFMEEGID